MEFDTVLDTLVSKLENASTLKEIERLVRNFAEEYDSPIIESNCVVLFYGSKDALQVALEGDWTGWKPTASLVYLQDTTPWYRIDNIPKNARFEYRVVVKGHPRLDPHNPQVTLSVFWSHSEFAMPSYWLPTELADRFPFRRGTLEQHWLKSEMLGDRRTFWINLLPRDDHTRRYPLSITMTVKSVSIPAMCRAS